MLAALARQCFYLWIKMHRATHIPFHRHLIFHCLMVSCAYVLISNVVWCVLSENGTWKVESVGILRIVLGLADELVMMTDDWRMSLSWWPMIGGWACHDDRWLADELVMMTDDWRMSLSWWPMIGGWACHDDRWLADELVMMTDDWRMSLSWWPMIGGWACHDDRWLAGELVMMTDDWRMSLSWWPMIGGWACHDDRCLQSQRWFDPPCF